MNAARKTPAAPDLRERAATSREEADRFLAAGEPRPRRVAKLPPVDDDSTPLSRDRVRKQPSNRKINSTPSGETPARGERLRSDKVMGRHEKFNAYSPIGSDDLELSSRRDAHSLKPSAERDATAEDPIFAAIERNREGMRLCKAAMDAAAAVDDSDPALVRARDKATEESWRRWREEVLQTRPTTAGGAQALARHALEWMHEQGEDGPDIADYRQALTLLAGPTADPLAALESTAGIRARRGSTPDVIPGAARLARKVLEYVGETPDPILDGDVELHRLARSVLAAAERTTPAEFGWAELRGMKISELVGLLEGYQRAVDLYGLLSFWPKVGRIGGLIISDECERIDYLREAILADLRLRLPTTYEEMDDKAASLIGEAVMGRDWVALAGDAAWYAAEVAEMRGRT